MKKINFVALDSSTLQWLRQALMERRSESEAAAELYRGVEELISGQLDSLMLEPGSSVSVPANDGLTCGDLTIHARSRQVLRGGEEIQLTPKEFDILYFLAPEPGHCLYQRADIPGHMGRGLLYHGQQHHGLYPEAPQENRA